MTLAEREAIRQRAENATQGPWWFRVFTGKKRLVDTRSDGAVMIGAVAPGHQIRANPPGGSFPSRDGEFIAHARSDVPALLAEVERLTKVIEEALTYHQTTHMHAVLRAALPAAEEGEP
jgi:hypothetical protein